MTDVDGGPGGVASTLSSPAARGEVHRLQHDISTPVAKLYQSGKKSPVAPTFDGPVERVTEFANNNNGSVHDVALSELPSKRKRPLANIRSEECGRERPLRRRGPGNRAISKNTEDPTEPKVCSP